jgi:hypothetical protein
MLSRRTLNIVVVLSGLMMIGAAPALGGLAASATISDTQNGSNYNYTMALTNTGTTGIGTFWFAWTPPGDPIEYDFLPSLPTPTGEPAGWVGPASPGFPGNSIEYYNLSGSAIAPGQTGTFSFTSPDSPTVLKGTQFGFPITTSFIYGGLPEVGSFAQVSPVAFVVPEPSSIALLAIGSAALLGRRRNPRTVG